MTTFASGFVIGAIAGAVAILMVQAVVIWAWLEHEERRYQSHVTPRRK